MIRRRGGWTWAAHLHLILSVPEFCDHLQTREGSKVIRKAFIGFSIINIKYLESNRLKSRRIKRYRWVQAWSWTSLMPAWALRHQRSPSRYSKIRKLRRAALQRGSTWMKPKRYRTSLIKRRGSKTSTLGQMLARYTISWTWNKHSPPAGRPRVSKLADLSVIALYKKPIHKTGNIDIKLTTRTLSRNTTRSKTARAKTNSWTTMSPIQIYLATKLRALRTFKVTGPPSQTLLKGIIKTIKNRIGTFWRCGRRRKDITFKI